MYSYEENNPSSVLFDNIHESLCTEFPNIKKNEIKFLYHGSYNVYEVKERYIFKFPDKNIHPELLPQEKAFLDFFKPYISYKIPEPLFYDFNSQQKYLGYKKISGISLSKHYHGISDKDKQCLAEQIVIFLGELHSTELLKKYQEKFPMRFSTEIYKKQIEQQFITIQEKFFPKLTIEQQKWLIKLFTEYLNDKRNFKFKPCIILSDFDTSNILIDPQKLAVTGIIDFEEPQIYDRAADLLFFGEGNAFTDHLVENYLKLTNIKDESLNTRRKFLYQRIPLIYMDYGLHFNLESMIKYSKDFLNYLMRTNL